MVVGLGKKDVESDSESSEECERTANLRQASAGEIMVPFFSQLYLFSFDNKHPQVVKTLTFICCGF